jgi:hypothetical protein
VEGELRNITGIFYEVQFIPSQGKRYDIFSYWKERKLVMLMN